MEAKTKKTIILAITLPTVVFLGWLAWDKLIQPAIAKRKEKSLKDDKKSVTKSANTTTPSGVVITSVGGRPEATLTTPATPAVGGRPSATKVS